MSQQLEFMFYLLFQSPFLDLVVTHLPPSLDVIKQLESIALSQSGQLEKQVGYLVFVLPRQQPHQNSINLRVGPTYTLSSRFSFPKAPNIPFSLTFLLHDHILTSNTILENLDFLVASFYIIRLCFKHGLSPVSYNYHYCYHCMFCYS